MNKSYWKPPFESPREEALLSSMLATHIGAQDYPGDAIPSNNWPGFAPGLWGPNNALSPKYVGDVSRLYGIDPKPPVLWLRGSDDPLVSDRSFIEMGTLGVPGHRARLAGDGRFPAAAHDRPDSRGLAAVRGGRRPF